MIDDLTNKILEIGFEFKDGAQEILASGNYYDTHHTFYTWVNGQYTPFTHDPEGITVLGTFLDHHGHTTTSKEHRLNKDENYSGPITKHSREEANNSKQNYKPG